MKGIPDEVREVGSGQWGAPWAGIWEYFPATKSHWKSTNGIIKKSDQWNCGWTTIIIQGKW